MDKLESALDRYTAIMQKAESQLALMRQLRYRNIENAVKRLQQVQQDAGALIKASASIPSVKIS